MTTPQTDLTARIDCDVCRTGAWCDLAERCLAECLPTDEDAPLRAVFDGPEPAAPPPAVDPPALVARERQVLGRLLSEMETLSTPMYGEMRDALRKVLASPDAAAPPVAAPAVEGYYEMPCAVCGLPAISSRSLHTFTGPPAAIVHDKCLHLRIRGWREATHAARLGGVQRIEAPIMTERETAALIEEASASERDYGSNGRIRVLEDALRKQTAALADVEGNRNGSDCAARTCPKAAHSNQGGYLHDADDDSPYDVDGVTYCGRCHMVMGR